MYHTMAPLLEEQGFEVLNLPKASLSELESLWPQITGMVGRSRFSLNRDLLYKCTSLKWIGRSGAGLEDIDLEAAHELGIAIINAPEGNRDAVGEHTLGMILALLNKMAWAHFQIGLGLWPREESRGYELANLTVGLIGYGNMGRAVAKRLVAFGCKILAYDPYTTNWEGPAEKVSLQYLKETTDVLSFHVPLTQETFGMFNSQFLSEFSQNIWLINTSRGKVVELNTVEEGLKTGKILGAALDVLPVENPANRIEELDNRVKRLAQLQNVLLTPHVAGWTYESYRRLNDVLAKKIKQFVVENGSYPN